MVKECWVNVYENRFMDFIGYKNKHDDMWASRWCLEFDNLKTIYRIHVKLK